MVFLPVFLEKELNVHSRKLTQCISHIKPWPYVEMSTRLKYDCQLYRNMQMWSYMSEVGWKGERGDLFPVCFH